MNAVHGGIQINLRRMNQTKVQKNGKLSSSGGGVMQYEITASLFEQGKQAGQYTRESWLLPPM